jgi:polar amino acid transport system substrate-binding protein
MAGPGDARAAESLVLVTPVNTVDTVISEVIVREAYRRLGISVTIKKYPGERALRLADVGKVDGEVQRIDGIAKNYPNLIQIKLTINFIAGTVFTKTVKFQVEGWQSLRPYRIGYVRGIKFAERNTVGMNALLAKDYSPLIRMLEKGRVDIAVSPSVNGWYQIRKMGVEGISDLPPPIMKFDLFHYLHKKHAALAPRISEVFAQMRESGELSEFRRRVVSIMLERAAKGLPLCDKDYSCFE